MTEFTSEQRHKAYSVTLQLVEKHLDEDTSPWKTERKALSLALVNAQDDVIRAMYGKYAALPDRKGRP